MSIAETIAALRQVPYDMRHLPLYVFTDDGHVEIAGESLYDSDDKHGADNPLSIDLKED